MGKSILITGASGFIGSFVVEEALKQNYSIWAGIREGSSKKYLKDRKIRFIDLDYAHPNELRAQLSEHKGTYHKFDYIIHCAGITKTTNDKEFDKTNFLHTKNLVDALIALNMVPKQFIFISSLSVYGPIHEDNFDKISITDTPVPNTSYGVSKLKAELYLSTIPGFPYVFFYPTGVYGPRDKDYYLLARSIQKHVDFSAGFKRQDLTFIYVKDLVKAIFLAIDKNITQRGYIVSDGKTYRSRSFSTLIRKELGNPFVIHIKCPLFILKAISLLAENVSKRLGTTCTLNRDKYKIMKQRNWRCDITPINEELGFEPDYTLEEGVKETIAWYKSEKWL